jgi:predicted transposase/invertase (TIGR01784 family)
VTTPHDRLFRYVFSDPEQAAGEIRLLLPEDVSRQVDWGTLKPLSGTFVDEVLEERRSDVLFRVELGGREALLYLLLEHQSSSDPLMPFRLLRYMVRIWDGYLAEHPEAKLLPAIVPMVVHHSANGWRAPTAFTDIVDLDELASTDLRRHLPSFELLLDDLSTTRDEDLHARVLVPALGRLSLLCLKWSSESSDVLKELRRAAELVRQVADAPSGVAALSAVVSYLLQVPRTSPEDLGTYFRALGPRTETAFMTGADMLRAEGRAEGEARALLRVLERRGIEPARRDRRLPRSRAARTLARPSAGGGVGGGAVRRGGWALLLPEEVSRKVDWGTLRPRGAHPSSPSSRRAGTRATYSVSSAQG